MQNMGLFEQESLCAAHVEDWNVSDGWACSHAGPGVCPDPTPLPSVGHPPLTAPWWLFSPFLIYLFSSPFLLPLPAAPQAEVAIKRAPSTETSCQEETQLLSTTHKETLKPSDSGTGRWVEKNTFLQLFFLHENLGTIKSIFLNWGFEGYPLLPPLFLQK